MQANLIDFFGRHRRATHRSPNHCVQVNAPESACRVIHAQRGACLTQSVGRNIPAADRAEFPGASGVGLRPWMLAPADLPIRRIDDNSRHSFTLVECPGLASDRERIDCFDPALSWFTVDPVLESGRHENAQQDAGRQPLTAGLFYGFGLRECSLVRDG